MKKFFSASLFLHLTIVALFLSHFHAPHKEESHKSYVTISLTKAPKVTPPKFKKKLNRKRKKVVKKALTQKKEDSPLEEIESEHSTAEAIQTKKLEYKDELYHFLKNKNHYPPIAAKLRQSGSVKVKIKINKSGLFENISLVSPSNFKSLNKGTLSFLNKVAKFKPLPKNLNSETFEVPIVYEL